MEFFDLPQAPSGFWPAWKDSAARTPGPIAGDQCPPWRLLLGNASVPRDLIRAKRMLDAIAADYPGDGRPVLLLPGFMASDHRMGLLRDTLEMAGYRAHGWGMGRNFGASADICDRIDARVAEITADCGQKVTLVGWSLGGLFAREYAKYAPRKVRAVVTMGTPFSGDARANRVWPIYQMIAGHSVDNPPFPCVRQDKPPVPTVALWSRRDGVIASGCAAGKAGERDRAIEVDCTHMGFAASPEGIRAVCSVLPSL